MQNPGLNFIMACKYFELLSLILGPLKIYIHIYAFIIYYIYIKTTNFLLTSHSAVKDENTEINALIFLLFWASFTHVIENVGILLRHFLL